MMLRQALFFFCISLVLILPYSLGKTLDVCRDHIATERTLNYSYTFATDKINSYLFNPCLGISTDDSPVSSYVNYCNSSSSLCFCQGDKEACYPTGVAALRSFEADEFKETDGSAGYFAIIDQGLACFDEGRTFTSYIWYQCCGTGETDIWLADADSKADSYCPEVDGSKDICKICLSVCDSSLCFHNSGSTGSAGSTSSKPESGESSGTPGSFVGDGSDDEGTSKTTVALIIVSTALVACLAGFGALLWKRPDIRYKFLGKSRV